MSGSLGDRLRPRRQQTAAHTRNVSQSHPPQRQGKAKAQRAITSLLVGRGVFSSVNRCLGRCDYLGLLYPVGGKVSWPSQDGTHDGRSSGKLPTDLARDPAVPLLRGHLKEEPSVSGKETRHPRIPAAPHTREPNRNRAPVPTGTQTEKDNGMDTAHRNPTHCSSAQRTGGHY